MTLVEETDGNLVVVPNMKILQNPVTNVTRCVARLSGDHPANIPAVQWEGAALVRLERPSPPPAHRRPPLHSSLSRPGCMSFAPRKGRVRLDVPFELHPRADVEKARRVALGALAKLGIILVEPPPKILVKGADAGLARVPLRPALSATVVYTLNRPRKI